MEVPTNSDQADKLSKKKHLCPTCGSSFTKRSDVIRHERTHTGEKPFKCDICGALFSQASSLKIHLRKHTGERPFKCQYCKQTFRHSHRLKSHITKFHSGSHLTCDLCGLQFHCRSDLGVHSDSHSSTCKENLSTDDNSKGCCFETAGHPPINTERGNAEQHPPKHTKRGNAEQHPPKHTKRGNAEQHPPKHTKRGNAEQGGPHSNHNASKKALVSRIRNSYDEIRSSSEHSKTFSRVGVYKSQFKSSPSSEGFMCEICGSLHSSPASLGSHCRKMHKDEGSPESSSRDLHRDEDRPSESSSRDLHRDEDRISESSSRDLHRDEDGTSESSSRDLHRDEDQPCKCSSSDSNFNQTSDGNFCWEKHLTCQVCGTCFARPEDINFHMVAHAEKHVCEKHCLRFSHRQDLNCVYEDCDLHVSHSSKKSFNHHQWHSITCKCKCFTSKKSHSQVFVIQEASINKGLRIETVNGPPLDSMEIDSEKAEEGEYTNKSRPPSCDSRSPSTPRFNESSSFPTFQDHYLSETENGSLKSDGGAENVTRISHNLTFSTLPGSKESWKAADCIDHVIEHMPTPNDTIETDKETVTSVSDNPLSSLAVLARAEENVTMGENVYPYTQEDMDVDDRDAHRITTGDQEKSAKSTENIQSLHEPAWVSRKSLPSTQPYGTSDNITLNDFSIKASSDNFYLGRFFNTSRIGMSPPPQYENNNSFNTYMPDTMKISVLTSHQQSSLLTSADFLPAIKGDRSVSENSMNLNYVSGTISDKTQFQDPSSKAEGVTSSPSRLESSKADGFLYKRKFSGKSQGVESLFSPLSPISAKHQSSSNKNQVNYPMSTPVNLHISQTADNSERNIKSFSNIFDELPYSKEGMQSNVVVINGVHDPLQNESPMFVSTPQTKDDSNISPESSQEVTRENELIYLSTENNSVDGFGILNLFDSDWKSKTSKYSTNGSQCVETVGLGDESGQNMLIDSNSKENNRAGDLGKSVTRSLPNEESGTVIGEIITLSSEDTKEISSTFSNFFQHRKGSREEDSVVKRKDSEGAGEKGTAYPQEGNQDSEKSALSVHETEAQVVGEMEAQAVHESETQLKCSNCPLGLFDASVISVLCEEECFGEMLERNMHSEEKHVEKSQDPTDLREISSSSIDPADEEAPRSAQTQRAHFDEEHDVITPGEEEPVESSSNILNGTVDKKESQSSMSPDTKSSLVVVNQSENENNVPSPPSHLAREQLNLIDKEKSHVHPLAPIQRPTTEYASSVSLSPLHEPESLGVDGFASKEVAHGQQYALTDKEETTTEVTIIKRSRGLLDKHSSGNRLAGKGILQRWSISKHKSYNRRVPNIRHTSEEDRSYACTQCHASFYQLVKLQHHKRIHSKKRSDLCQICHLSFVFQTGFKSDMKLNVGQKKTSIKSLKISTVTNDNTSECHLIGTNVLCGDDSNVSFNHSPKTASDQESAIYLCQFCGEPLSNLRSLNLHIKAHGRKSQYDCNSCSSKFNKKSNLVKHKLIHSGERPFKCTYCSKKFTQRANLQVHMRIHTGEQPFSCSLCNASFTHSQALKLHMRFHAKETRFICPTCGKGFVVKAALEKHYLSHTKEKPYACNICNAKLSSISSLSRHMKKHKLAQGPLAYSCPVCSAQFAQSGHLKLHLKSHPSCKAGAGDLKENTGVRG